MATLNLLNSFGRLGTSYGLYSLKADVIDSQYSSQYFAVSNFNSTLTAGKNAFSINGTPYLLNNAAIYIECLDSSGNNLYIDLARNSDNTATSNNVYTRASTEMLYSIYVFDNTADGVGWIILYGTLVNGKTVKWIQNITINKSLPNQSSVLFYQVPTFDIQSVTIPALNYALGSSLVQVVNLSGDGHTLAVNPTKDTPLNSINVTTTLVDYRFTWNNTSINNSTSDILAFSSQMEGYPIVLNINSITTPGTYTGVTSISQTASFTILNVLTNNTLQLDHPFTYPDAYGNDVVTNIVDANFSIEYPYVNYNSNTNLYETGSTGNTSYTVQNSYADITYTNLRTFTGYVASHNIYARSLLTPSDFTLVASAPISYTELLTDNNTSNTYYSSIGIFYNSQSIHNHYFTSSNNLSMSNTPTYAIDSMLISSGNPSVLTGSDYIIVKNSSDPGQSANATYVPYDETQYLNESGSAYDSNFIQLLANVQHQIVFSAVINKSYSANAKLTLYFTSSIPEASKEMNFTNNFGVKLLELIANESGSVIDFTDDYTFYTPQNTLYGTLVIVPTLCTAYIKNISLTIFGDDGFSPDAFVTQIPWPVTIANEGFEIIAELLDNNGNVIYSDLNAVQGFDVYGQSLLPSGGGGSSGNVTVNNLTVVDSLTVESGVVEFPNIPPRDNTIPNLYQTRVISVNSSGEVVFTPITDVTADDEHITVTLGDPTNVYDVTPTTIQLSLTSQYNGINSGRKITFDSNGNKVIETGP